MNHCQNTRAVGAWLDGELAPPEAEATRRHVETCVTCREEQRQLERLHSTLHVVLKADTKLPFDPFWRGVQQRIAENRSWYEDVRDWIRDTFTAPRLAWAVPAVIVLVLAGFSVDSFWPGLKSGTQRDNFAAVESIDAYGRNVALLREDETKTTVIWLYQNQESENESSTETTETKPSF